MQRLEQMLAAHQGQPLYVAEVCGAIGVSVRTLQLYCREQFGVSPHRYLRLRRMNLVRQALASADPATKTVTEIATDYGFWELGRFAVAFRNLFGETPSATLRRARSEELRPTEGTIYASIKELMMFRNMA